MAENIKLSSAETEEYNEIVSGVKEEYKKKITQEIQNAKREMTKEAVSLLGQEFIDLLTERKRLLSEFGEKARAVLKFAINNKMADEVKRLTEWSENSGKQSAVTGEGNKLFKELVAKIEVYRPDIANPLKECEQKLVDNNDRIKKLVANKKNALKTIESKYRDKLKNVIFDLVVEFNKKIVVINQSFGIENSNAVPLDVQTDDISISFTESDEDEIFISSGNDDIIN